MVHVSCTMRRTKNQPSNFISCSENALRLFVLLAIPISVQDRSPHMSFILKGSSILALLLKGLVRIQDVNPRT